MPAIPLATPLPNASAALPKAPLIGVLYNPGSGTNRKAPQALRRVLAAHPEVLHRDVSDATSIARALDELARLGANTLALAGGDGTCQAALSVLFGPASPFAQPPRLAVLRAGTTNMTAGDVGLEGPPARALARLIDALARKPLRLAITQRPILCIQIAPNRAPICGMYFGAAAIVAGVEYCTHKVHRVGLRGELGPGITLARFALAMTRGHSKIVPPITLSVSLDGATPTTSRCWIVQVTTLERLFLGLKPFWGGEPAPLHYTHVRARPAHWLRALPRLLRGRPNHLLTPANGYTSHNVQQLELDLTGNFIVDGEIFAAEPGHPLLVSSAGPADFLQWTAG